jgi:hypothetical protein
MSDLVGLQGESPDVLGKLSQLIQIRGQRAHVQQEEQTARQRAAMAKYDWNQHIGEDGTIDVESVASDPELAARPTSMRTSRPPSSSSSPRSRLCSACAPSSAVRSPT